MTEMAAIKDLLEHVCDLLRGDKVHITTYEFKNSGILKSFEYLLTQSPSMNKYLLLKDKLDGQDDIKHSE